MTQTTLVYHLGAPSADFDQLIWSLRKDRAALEGQGIMVRKQRVYRTAIANGLMAKQLGDISVSERSALLDKLSLGEERSRLIMTDSSFLGEHRDILRGGRLYEDAGVNSRNLLTLFEDVEVEFLLAVRNPASLLSEMAELLEDAAFSKMINEVDFSKLRWSQVVSDIQQANPDCVIKIWRYEDSPVLWPKILREATDLPPTTELSGELDLCAGLLDELPFERLKEFLSSRPEFRLHEKRRTIRAFIEKFGDAQKAEQGVDIDGANPEFLRDVDNFYMADCEKCKLIPNVAVLD